MSDDITFCFDKDCKNKECFRHQSNIRTPWKDHSFAFLKGTDECPLKEDKDENR